jgi:general secretion pathway protein H
MGIMLTSKAGTSIKTSGNNSKGFTLLELIVVIAILGSVLLIVFPRIPYFENFALNSEARRVAGILRYLDESASAKKIYYRAWFSPEKSSIEVEASADGVEFKKSGDESLQGLTFKDGIEIVDLVLAGLGKVDHGDVAVVFNPGAGAEPFNLHMKKNNRIITISYNPYSGKVTVADGYV